MNAKNVLIPVELLIRIFELLRLFDVSSYDDFIKNEHNDVQYTIQSKLQALHLRKAYSQLLFAKDEDERFFARLEYMNLRSVYKKHPSSQQ